MCRLDTENEGQQEEAWPIACGMKTDVSFWGQLTLFLWNLLSAHFQRGCVITSSEWTVVTCCSSKANGYEKPCRGRRTRSE